MPEVNMPSVKIGPTKFCIFGVKRKGTTSLVAKIGVWLEMPDNPLEL